VTLLTLDERIRIRLDATQPRAVREYVDPTTDELVLSAAYRTDGQAHAAALAFSGRRVGYPDRVRFVAFPAPGQRIDFAVDDQEPRHRLPGRPRSGPARRTVLSGRHIDHERAVA